MFDLSSIQELDRSTLKVTHPETGALIGAEIELASANHPKRKQCEFNHSRVLRARVAKKGRLELTDPQDDADYEVDRLVACTLSWTGFARDGKPIECTPGEVRAIFESTAWLRAQAVEFMGDAANFLQSTKSI
jgi:hypothetical protein